MKPEIVKKEPKAFAITGTCLSFAALMSDESDNRMKN
jgi:hypothetical protein